MQTRDIIHRTKNNLKVKDLDEEKMKKKTTVNIIRNVNVLNTQCVSAKLLCHPTDEIYWCSSYLITLPHSVSSPRHHLRQQVAGAA